MLRGSCGSWQLSRKTNHDNQLTFPIEGQYAGADKKSMKFIALDRKTVGATVPENEMTRLSKVSFPFFSLGVSISLINKSIKISIKFRL